MFLIHLIKKIIESKRNLKLNKNDLQNLQLEKFRKLVKYCYANSIYYKKIIDIKNIDIKNCIPEDFPTLTKEIVLENFDDIVTDKRITKERIMNFLENSHDPQELFLDQFFVVHTSGTSGKKGLYIFNKEEMATTIVNSSRATTIAFNQKLAYIAAIDDHYAGISMAYQSKKVPFIYKDFLPLHVNQPFQEVLKKLNEFQPTNLGGYSFAIAQIAKAQEKGIINIHPKYIQVGGEPLRNEDKELIERVFKAPIVNVYASSEFLFIGIGKKEFEDKMMLMDDQLYFEIEEKKSLITNLFCYTLPLIRYEMNDILVKTELNNPPQKTAFTFIENIVGRDEQNPYFVNEFGDLDFVNSHTIDFFINHITSLQFILKSQTSFELTYVYDQNISEKDKQEAKNNLKNTIDHVLCEKRMKNVTYFLKEVSKIWADPNTGKFKLIIKDY
jgi:phenylacetate-CoA ligase